MMSLAGRVAVVTGGSGHLGSCFCRGLAELGASVVVLDQDEARADATAAAVAAEHGGRTMAVPVDLADDAGVRRVPSLVEAELGGVDILVHCASLVGTTALDGWAVPFEDQSVETWRKAMDVNLTSAFVLSQSAAPLLRRSGKGSVVLVGSIYGLVGPQWALYEGGKLGNPAAYAASKGGLAQFTRWLATTLAPDVRVNTLSPGGIMRGHEDPFLARYTERTPLGRMATETDMLGGLVYLASDLSSYVTGHDLVIDGGWTAW